MSQSVGLIALQGDYEKHRESFLACGVPAENILNIRQPHELEKVDRIVIPGGESTTVGLLMSRYQLGPALVEFANQGKPIWGTCMGMIIMAKEIEGREQYSLKLMDITVRRNAFGSQIHSFEVPIQVRGFEEPMISVFIRAPIVTNTGSNVEVLAKYEGDIVAVQEGKLLGTSFHPELTQDIRFHEYFLNL